MPARRRAGVAAITVKPVSTPLNILERTPGRKRLGAAGTPPLIIAHRGAAADAPENTLPAFELALGQGADGIEFDVHFSSDGVPVVIHDPHLERTTSGSGRVRDYSIDKLRYLDAGSWFNRRFPAKATDGNAGLKIPLLAEVLAWVRKRNCQAFVEIKEGGDTYPGIERTVVEEIHRSGARPLVTVISFDLPSLRRCRELDCQLKIGVDFSRPVRAVAQARAISAESLLPHWMFATPRFIASARRAGLRVLAWGLDLAGPIEQKMTAGIDGLITENLASAAAIRAGLWGQG
jgi:glycerophosphoryl diester phosphodiesterase